MSNSIHSDRTSLLIGSKRFEKGPFFDFYHNEKFVYGVYAGRFYPVFMDKNHEDMYWALRQRSVLYDVPERPIQIEGPQVVDFLEKVFSRRIENLKVGRGRYAIACNHEGGLFMDGVLFRLIVFLILSLTSILSILISTDCLFSPLTIDSLTISSIAASTSG